MKFASVEQATCYVYVFIQVLRLLRVDSRLHSWAWRRHACLEREIATAERTRKAGHLKAMLARATAKCACRCIKDVRQNYATMQTESRSYLKEIGTAGNMVDKNTAKLLEIRNGDILRKLHLLNRLKTYAVMSYNRALHEDGPGPVAEFVAKSYDDYLTVPVFAAGSAALENLQGAYSSLLFVDKQLLLRNGTFHRFIKPFKRPFFIKLMSFHQKYLGTVQSQYKKCLDASMLRSIIEESREEMQQQMKRSFSVRDYFKKLGILENSFCTRLDNVIRAAKDPLVFFLKAQHHMEAENEALAGLSRYVRLAKQCRSMRDLESVIGNLVPEVCNFYNEVQRRMGEMHVARRTFKREVLPSPSFVLGIFRTECQQQASGGKREPAPLEPVIDVAESSPNTGGAHGELQHCPEEKLDLFMKAVAHIGPGTSMSSVSARALRAKVGCLLKQRLVEWIIAVFLHICDQDRLCGFVCLCSQELRICAGRSWRAFKIGTHSPGERAAPENEPGKNEHGLRY